MIILILKVDKSDEQHNFFYLESRKSNSFKTAYNQGNESDNNQFFFSLFVLLGRRFWLDEVTIHSKYEGKSWGEESHYLFEENPGTIKHVWPIPRFRHGFLFGFRI